VVPIKDPPLTGRSRSVERPVKGNSVEAEFPISLFEIVNVLLSSGKKVVVHF